jgi:hypothetical protein
MTFSQVFVQARYRKLTIELIGYTNLEPKEIVNRYTGNANPIF